MARIDEALGQIRMAVQSLGGSVVRRKPGRPPAMSMTVSAPAPKKSRRGRRGSYATTAEESVVAFIQQNRNPSTRDITAHWRTEGRGGKADNLLSRLVKEKKLRRQSNAGERGSRYSLI
jgi:hypothetical protein